MRKSAILFLVSLAGLGLMLEPGEAQSGACRWYADTALKQQQQNERRKCGFAGPAWNSDHEAHLAWCAQQRPDAWRAAARERARLLAGCKG
jgi:hypothetical protein